MTPVGDEARVPGSGARRPMALQYPPRPELQWGDSWEHKYDADDVEAQSPRNSPTPGADTLTLLSPKNKPLLQRLRRAVGPGVAGAAAVAAVSSAVAMREPLQAFAVQGMAYRLMAHYFQLCEGLATLFNLMISLVDMENIKVSVVAQPDVVDGVSQSQESLGGLQMTSVESDAAAQDVFWTARRTDDLVHVAAGFTAS